MSALLPLIASHRAMAAALEAEAEHDQDGKIRDAVLRCARVNRRAADLLEAEMKAGCSGPETCAGCGAAAPAPGKRCAVCQRLKV